MTTKSKAVFIVLPLLILTGVFVFLFCYNQEGFTGSRVKNPDAYLLDIQRMNGTDLHTLALHKGDALHIQFETVKGSLYMEIKAPDGTTIYRGNGKETTDFTVNIPEDGVYPVVVTARHARGTIHIRREEGTYMGQCDLSLASPILASLLDQMKNEVEPKEQLTRFKADCLDFLHRISTGKE